MTCFNFCVLTVVFLKRLRSILNMATFTDVTAVLIKMEKQLVQAGVKRNHCQWQSGKRNSVALKFVEFLRDEVF